MVSVQARGGNYLLNIGPRGNGSIVGFESDVLHSIGSWLVKHSDAVMGASATEFGGQSWGEVIVNDNEFFLHVMDWPKEGELTLPGLANKVNNVYEDGTSNELDWHRDGDDLIIELPDHSPDDILPVIKAEFEGDLSIIPEDTVSSDSDNTWSIESDEIEGGYNYADQGNYSNTEQTNVRQTAYLEAENDEPVYLDLKADADEDKQYKIEIGDYSKEVTGEELNHLVDGPINLPAKEVVPLTIKLAVPEHENEDMGMEFKSAYLTPVSNASSIKEIVKHYEDDEKVIKHLKGFEQLFAQYKEQGMILEKSYEALKIGMDSLAEKWK